MLMAFLSMSEGVFANYRKFCAEIRHACTIKHLHVSVASYSTHTLYIFLQLSYVKSEFPICTKASLTSHICVVANTKLPSVTARGLYPRAINVLSMRTFYPYVYPLINPPLPYHNTLAPAFICP